MSRERGQRFREDTILVAKEAWRDGCKMWVLDITSSETTKRWQLQTESLGMCHSWGIRTKTSEIKKHKHGNKMEISLWGKCISPKATGESFCRGETEKAAKGKSFVFGSCALKAMKIYKHFDFVPFRLFHCFSTSLQACGVVLAARSYW